MDSTTLPPVRVLSKVLRSCNFYLLLLLWILSDCPILCCLFQIDFVKCQLFLSSPWILFFLSLPSLSPPLSIVHTCTQSCPCAPTHVKVSLQLNVGIFFTLLYALCTGLPFLCLEMPCPDPVYVGCLALECFVLLYSTPVLIDATAMTDKFGRRDLSFWLSDFLRSHQEI